MYNRQIWQPVMGNSLLYTLDGRTKLAVMVVMAVAAMLIDSAATLFILLLAVFALHGWARMPAGRWRLFSVVILLGIWGSMASQALFYNQEPRTVLACLLSADAPVVGSLTGGIYLYQEGLEYGAVQALRTSVMSGLGLLVCWTTDARQLLNAFLAWRMPYHLAFMVTTALRFLPVTAQEAATVLMAQRLRGLQPAKSWSVPRFVQSAFRTLFPVLTRTIRRAATLALSVQSRGFGRGGAYQDQLWPKLQRSGVYLLAALICLAAAGKVMYWLQYNGIVYISSWHKAYDFMKAWL